jgi:hypothetical protein
MANNAFCSASARSLGALESYDFVVFVFFTSAIQSLFFSTTSSRWQVRNS